jgi:farnesyl diphosphate synthase
MGAIAAGASAAHVAALDRYGRSIGLAFQVADDVLNATASADDLGKPTGSDAARGKLTAVALHGVDGARAMAARLVDEAVGALWDGAATAPLRALAAYVTARTH